LNLNFDNKLLNQRLKLMFEQKHIGHLIVTSGGIFTCDKIQKENCAKISIKG